MPTLGGFCLSLPLAGDAAKQLDNIADAIKLANKIPTSPFSAKIDNCAERLTMKDLIGATRELKGEVVKRKASGVPWDHVDEVRNAQGSYSIKSQPSTGNWPILGRMPPCETFSSPTWARQQNAGLLRAVRPQNQVSGA
ncbi:polymorphic toxin type 28 domain-containing protein [Streptomyces sp. NBC_00439]|uniref:polymorphic toxin type 28 domain-containing protein n=1 Tax=Streptomyces sp. NBC_00439 TaxID=2903650 RepID=UPI0033900A82